MNVRKFTWLHRKSFIGKIIRLPFKLLPGSIILPILSGRMRGKFWIKGSHNISVLLGLYERLQSAEFYKSAKGAGVFWDLGAHVGYYSLLYIIANPVGKVYAFEPLEKNTILFSKHMDLNHVSAGLYNMAVSNRDGILSFNLGRTSVAGKLSSDGSVSVKVVRLSDLLLRGDLQIPQLIKMDIEGEEYKVLEDLQEILREHKPQIFLSTHSSEVHDQCIALLTRLKYSFKPLDDKTLMQCREVFVYPATNS